MTNPRQMLSLAHMKEVDQARASCRQSEQAMLRALLNARDLEGIGAALKGLTPYLGPDLKAVPLIDRPEGGRHD